MTPDQRNLLIGIINGVILLSVSMCGSKMLTETKTEVKDVKAAVQEMNLAGGLGGPGLPSANRPYHSIPQPPVKAP